MSFLEEILTAFGPVFFVLASLIVAISVIWLLVKVVNWIARSCSASSLNYRSSSQAFERITTEHVLNKDEEEKDDGPDKVTLNIPLNATIVSVEMFDCLICYTISNGRVIIRDYDGDWEKSYKETVIEVPHEAVKFFVNFEDFFFGYTLPNGQLVIKEYSDWEDDEPEEAVINIPHDASEVVVDFENYTLRYSLPNGDLMVIDYESGWEEILEIITIEKK